MMSPLAVQIESSSKLVFEKKHGAMIKRKNKRKKKKFSFTLHCFFIYPLKNKL